MSKGYFPLLPLSDVVLFPQMSLQVLVRDDTPKNAIAAAINRADGRILFVPRVEGVYARVGTVGQAKLSQLPLGIELMEVTGEYRARVGAGKDTEMGVLMVEAERIGENQIADEETDKLAKEYRLLLENLLETREINEDFLEFIKNIRDTEKLIGMSAYSPDLNLEQKIKLLEMEGDKERLGYLIEETKRTLEDAALKVKIRNSVNEGMKKRKREFILHRQMDAIKKELGEESSDVNGQYREKFTTAELPETVKKAVEDENKSEGQANKPWNMAGLGLG